MKKSPKKKPVKTQAKKRTSLWTHPKQKKWFESSYSFCAGERNFNLTNGKRTITFESWQMAKGDGWTKV